MVKGHERLNLAFVANLFNMHPGLEPPAEVIIITLLWQVMLIMLVLEVMTSLN